MYVQCTCNANITRFCDIFLFYFIILFSSSQILIESIYVLIAKKINNCFTKIIVLLVHEYHFITIYKEILEPFHKLIQCSVSHWKFSRHLGPVLLV